MPQLPSRPQPPGWPIVLSIIAALSTMGLKFFAFFISGSIGLLSDALESVINLVAAVLAFVALRYAARPPDAEHTYGHEKISYFSSGMEGTLILIAAVSIAWQALQRLLHPAELTSLDSGLLCCTLAAGINCVVAHVLMHQGRKHGSIILEADGQHLMADVWTSVAVLVALALVWLTGWSTLDPLIALAVALNILVTGLRLMRRSFDGLMDRAWPKEDLDQLRMRISENLRPGMAFHALRTRTSGSRLLVEFHLLVPGAMSLREAHTFADRLEHDLLAHDPKLDITIHLEPIEAAESWGDHELAGFEKT